MTRISGAAARGLLVALLLATPALTLPDVADDSSQIVLVMAMLAAFLTFAEYNAKSPSIVEFRDAPPFNRLRFVALFSCVFMLSLICKGRTDPTAVTTSFKDAYRCGAYSLRGLVAIRPSLGENSVMMWWEVCLLGESVSNRGARAEAGMPAQKKSVGPFSGSHKSQP